jgi:hypothetical protein
MAIPEGYRQDTRAKLGAALEPSWPGSRDELQSLVSQVEQQLFEKAKGLADYDKRVEKRVAKIPVAVARTITPPRPDSRAAPAPPPVLAPTPAPPTPPVLAPTPMPRVAPAWADLTAEVLAAAQAHVGFIDAFRKRFPTPAAVQATDPRVVAKLSDLVAHVRQPFSSK